MTLKFARELAKQGVQESYTALKDQFYEETLARGFVISYEKNIDTAFRMLYEYSTTIDNWAACDSTCNALKIFKKDKDNVYFTKFLDMSKSDSEYVARVGIVMILSHYMKDELIDTILLELSSIKNHAYYVDMAAAWLISVSLIKNYELSIEHLKKKYYTKFIQNKAISKYRESFKPDSILKEDI